jgi:hypothetical protein
VCECIGVVCCVRPPAGQWSTGAALGRGMDSSLLTSVSTDVHTPTGMQIAINKNYAIFDTHHAEHMYVIYMGCMYVCMHVLTIHECCPHNTRVLSTRYTSVVLT